MPLSAGAGAAFNSLLTGSFLASFLIYYIQPNSCNQYNHRRTYYCDWHYTSVILLLFFCISLFYLYYRPPFSLRLSKPRSGLSTALLRTAAPSPPLPPLWRPLYRFISQYYLPSGFCYCFFSSTFDYLPLPTSPSYPPLIPTIYATRRYGCRKTSKVYYRTVGRIL